MGSNYSHKGVRTELVSATYKIFKKMTFFGKLVTARLGNPEHLGSPGFRKTVETIAALVGKLFMPETN